MVIASLLAMAGPNVTSCFWQSQLKKLHLIQTVLLSWKLRTKLLMFLLEILSLIWLNQRLCLLTFCHWLTGNAYIKRPWVSDDSISTSASCSGRNFASYLSSLPPLELHFLSSSSPTQTGLEESVRLGHQQDCLKGPMQNKPPYYLLLGLSVGYT